MLLYHPFFDAYHCTFRLLRLLETVGRVEVETAPFESMGFLSAFPSRSSGRSIAAWLDQSSISRAEN